MQNIIFLIDRLDIGGTEKQLVLLLKNLDRDRFKPILITLRDSIYVESEDIQCDIHILNINSIMSLDGVLSIFHAAKFIRKLRPVIIHTYFVDSALVGVIVGKILRVKGVITSRRDLGFWFSKKTIFTMNVLNKFTDKIIVNSRAIKEYVEQTERIKKDKIEVIHNGIERIYGSEEIQRYRELNRKKFAVSRTTKIIGIVSNLNRNVKRVDIFIKAAVKYLKKNDNVVFVIVGAGHLKDTLKQIIKKESEEEKFLFLGSIQNPIEVICSFDVAVNTSETEGFSNSVIESMAHGVCTIASDNPGNKELIENDVTGVLFPVNDVDALVDSLSYVLVDDEARTRLALTAREYVINNFTLDNMISKHERLYEEMCCLSR
ncbi:MAG: glycosyltransferase [Candidatus Thiodiazotropha weberae]|nr:glycosyltransferase [Candidatus Thiodiazotropha lotti]MCG8012443.1 glycosyltransferase [Candidatus Thiodiazotropha lotti]MCW4211913.1 glycosyltransferase [Candidatus Thiodiazotropha lotti]MCW4215892.1 glycosyltransferase [Candidatus Thiodiazotropha lotti]